jgi:hypothetical protein
MLLIFQWKIQGSYMQIYKDKKKKAQVIFHQYLTVFKFYGHPTPNIMVLF